MPAPDAGEAVFVDELDRVLAALSFRVDDEAREKLLEHYRLLTRWNRRLNLTRIRDPRESARLHFGESLFLAHECGLESGSLADLGSGAGFPGLPIAACRPAVAVSVVESVSKKAVFLSEVSRGWPNVTVWNGRIEDLELRFDWAAARAVAPREMLPALARIAGRVAVLTGPRGVKMLTGSDAFEWDEPRRAPWGRERFFVLGRSRST